MVWTMQDYPSSMKNLDKATRKKAIDIANSMIDDGYKEGQAIPIAIEQAKEWKQHASQSEINTYQSQGSPTKRSEEGKQSTSNPERLEEGEEVYKHDDGWAVASVGSDRASEVFSVKKEAIARAVEIARNKGTSLTIYKEDGTKEEKRSYAE
ncbi:DUF2188 domain-containing protein [Oceanobacillus iheyensis]|uniref:Hypothetical conserved protein n=1 Tax=Oceanobacillus iheyensis (strain DSM 14371 / CIP 107618 / JCM 11309 / KCTC 3954 / HTE831) TaxID=221109 RepID=Q8ESS9_OCEIH|nr:DUF2188 domain-containing protein [Oceanobacillus iheyensis]BAC12494.1 hypothetical conserved protein [Oceanobacillus iheyensis HTE831]